MSLAPLIFRDLWSYGWVRPFRLLDHHLGMTGHYGPFVKNALENLDNNVHFSTDKDKFEVKIDVKQFSPNEITVKTVNENTIVIEGKHESKGDKDGEQGYLYKHFSRKYALPSGVDITKIVSNLTADGVLTVSAPKLENVKEKLSERVIPIQQVKND